MSKDKDYIITTLSGNITQRTFREYSSCPPTKTPVVAPFMVGTPTTIGSRLYNNVPYRVYITDGSNIKLDPRIVGSSTPPSLAATQYCNLNHWWKMPSTDLETNPPTTAIDGGRSSPEINFTASNITISSNGRTISGSSFDTYAFNGSNSTMYVNNATSLEPYPMTITFWVKPSSWSLYDVIFINNESQSNWSRGMGCYANTADDKLWFWNRNWINTRVSVDLPTLDTWTHIACVLQGGTGGHTMYANGIPGTSVTGIEPRSVETDRWFVIGSNGYGTGETPVTLYYNYDGLLSDFRIYNKVLTGAQIAAIMNGDYEP